MRKVIHTCDFCDAEITDRYLRVEMVERQNGTVVQRIGMPEAIELDFCDRSCFTGWGWQQ